MGPADEVEIVGLKKIGEDVGPKNVTNASLFVLQPPLLLLHGVRPQQIAQHPLRGNIGRPVQRQDFSYFGQLGAESSVHA